MLAGGGGGGGGGGGHDCEVDGACCMSIYCRNTAVWDVPASVF